MPVPQPFNSDPADVLRRSLQDLERRTHALGLTIDSLRTSLLGLDNATKSSSGAIREFARLPMHIGHVAPHMFSNKGSQSGGSFSGPGVPSAMPPMSGPRPFVSNLTQSRSVPSSQAFLPAGASWSRHPSPSAGATIAIGNRGSSGHSSGGLSSYFFSSLNSAAVALGVLATGAGIASSAFLKVTASASPSGAETVGKMFNLLAGQIGTQLMPQLGAFIEMLHDARGSAKRNGGEIGLGASFLSDTLRFAMRGGVLNMRATDQYLTDARAGALAASGDVDGASSVRMQHANRPVRFPDATELARSVWGGSYSGNTARSVFFPSGAHGALAGPGTEDARKMASWREMNREKNRQQLDSYISELMKGRSHEDAVKASGWNPPKNMSHLTLEQMNTATPRYGSIDDMYQQVQVAALRSSPLDQELKQLQNQSYLTLNAILAQITEAKIALQGLKPAAN